MKRIVDLDKLLAEKTERNFWDKAVKPQSPFESLFIESIGGENAYYICYSPIRILIEAISFQKHLDFLKEPGKIKETKES